MTLKEPDENKQHGGDRCEGFTLLQKSAWRVAFLRDVTIGQALTVDNGGAGISSDGECGLASILEDIEKDINRAIDCF